MLTCILHILRALRVSAIDEAEYRAHEADAEIYSQNGINPCGWCGKEGCRTSMTWKKNAKNPTILSDCKYHYQRMNYSKSAVYSEEKMCTNVPIHCPLCPKGQNNQPLTFWKYNFIPHMAECHLIDDKLPPLPEEFKIATHISRAEEESMGVELI